MEAVTTDNAMSCEVAAMSGINAALRLRRISAAIREGQPIPAEDAEPLAEGIDAYFGGQFPTLDAALGVASNGRGGLSARRAVVLADRDEALAELADIVGGAIGGEDSEGVWNIADALGGYLDIEAGHDRAEAERLVAVILSANNARPLSRKQIANVFQKFGRD